MLIKLVIYFRVAFIQGFLMYYDNLITSAKFLGYGMKTEPSDPDSPKIGKAYDISLTTALNNLCKNLPMFALIITILSIPLNLISFNHVSCSVYISYLCLDETYYRQEYLLTYPWT